MANRSERRYTEAEVSVILRLAADKNQSVDAEGMTLDELVAVANEAGIDPLAIRSAASRIDSLETNSRGLNVFGVQPYTELVRYTEGEPTDDNWAEIVAEMRSAFQGPTGETSQLGKTLEWYGGTEFTAIQMSLTPENGRTRVRARLNSWAVAPIAYGFAIVMGMLATTMIVKSASKILPDRFDPSTTLLFAAVFMLAILAWTRIVVGSWYAKKTGQMNNALDRVDDVLTSTHLETAQRSSQSASEAQPNQAVQG